MRITTHFSGATQFGAALSLALCSAVGNADDAPDGSDARTLDSVVVEGQQAKKVSSPKYTQPLLDTPQTVTQVPRMVIEDQNLLGLQDILATLPGITFGAGEGGGGYGDSINLRGFPANSDITVDGLRDSAQYTRSDTFNVESIEVIHGANSVHSGAGAVGGTINLVSKVAGEREFNRVQAGVGSDRYLRGTVDSNFLLGESAALRLNLMRHENDQPGRDVDTAERWGFAPSIAFGLGSDTRFTLSYLRQEDENTPEYGVPYYNGGPLPGVDPSTYFGYRNVDVQEIGVDSFTALFEHQFSDNFSLRNITRQAIVEQFSRVDPPQGTYCLDTGINPATGASCNAPGTYQPSGPRGTTRDTRNELLVTQTDVLAHFDTGGIAHDLVLGFSLSDESFALDSGNSLRNPDGSVVALPRMDLYHPDTRYTGPVNFIRTALQRGELDNRAVYALDTLNFNEQWLLNLGARWERNEGTHRTDVVALPSAGGAITAGPELRNDEDLFSWRAGLVWKPAPHATVYLSRGNSKSPSKASVNGACTAQTCDVDAETAVITELGGKWDLYDGALSLTASIFRNDRQNYRVADLGNPDNPSGEQQLDGRARVDGLLLGVAGRINERWAVYANYSRLESEVLQGVSDRQSGLGLDYTRGDRLLNTPEDSIGLWTAWDIAPGWQIGYGASYLGKVWLTQHSATNVDGPLVTAPGYWVQRAMVSWEAIDDLQLQLNLNNLADKEYYQRPRNNGWAVPGDARNATLTATYVF
ncbi:MAG: TonB-dependent receptor [Xanthomonadales bacterium]|nr:putative TonB-dependent receptor BfrD [Xanthomonadales bacterium]MCC6592772.1 TonB-dependent receptor [Xanthomonadales bacterium]MCE7932522.1 TonB-dependent receptor [Xanthomonadales bacterium PRO6]